MLKILTTPPAPNALRLNDEASKDRLLLIQHTGQYALWASYPEPQAIALLRLISSRLGGWAGHEWSGLLRWNGDGSVAVYVRHVREV